MNTQNQKGFTLIEIAIVLVIIGLLLGGVMKGQELITGTKVKNDIAAMQAFQTAMYSYEDRVGRYPGDSNKDRKISAAYSNNTGTTSFFQELAAEGFISDATPSPKLTDYFLVQYGTNANVTASNATGIIANANQMCLRSYEAANAQSIDTKLDDGVYNTGLVRANAAYAADTLVKICMKM